MFDHPWQYLLVGILLIMGVYQLLWSDDYWVIGGPTRFIVGPALIAAAVALGRVFGAWNRRHPPEETN